ncbi:hypothetical protein GW915_06285 [bacterium]|nr:hypothetical protein [bacterium]
MEFLFEKLNYHCVNVHVLKESDKRVVNLKDHPSISYYSSPQPFAAMALSKAPVPSNQHYDAKVWEQLVKYGQDGDLWWNVAR